MKDLRHGDQLWLEWDGNELSLLGSIAYYTIEHVDMNEEVVRRALASALQRDGVADSLADAFKLLEHAQVECVWAGPVEDDRVLTICNDDGETYYGEDVDMLLSITVVHIA